MTATPYFLLAGTVLLTIFADYFLKTASGQPNPFQTVPFAIGAVCYLATAIGWMLLMRDWKLATVGVWYSIANVLVMSAMGYLLFGERLSVRELVGIALAVGALALMA